MGIEIDIFNEQLTKSEEVWAKKWIDNYTNIIMCLTNIHDFNEETIRKLIVYEATHKQRIGLINRLVARYSKLCRNRIYDRILKDMKRFRRYENIKI